MQVEYKKEWMDTYLWVLSENQKQDNYIEKMLLCNQGEGRLEFSKQQKEGEEYYCYKITGKKALNSVYSMMTIGERQIKAILQQLFETLEKGKEYLLLEEDFVISPPYIFATFPQMDIELCYVPGYSVSLKEQLESLFEYLLNRVDYDDKKAVELLYNCYMFCMKEEGGLAEIKKLLAKEVIEPIEEKEASFFYEERKEEQKETVQKNMLPQKDLYQNKKESRKHIVYEDTEHRKKEKTSYFSWLSDFLFRKSKKEEVPFVVAEEKEEYDIKPKKQETIEEERTVLLSAMMEREEVGIVCKTSGEWIPLIKFPFYIGSVPEYTDYLIKKEGVSRIHCCINKKGESYYISDLNSTNGTYLNKKEVLPGKDELLSANDEISIASVDFYVKFSCH